MTAQLISHLQAALILLEIPNTDSIAIDLNIAAQKFNRSNYQIAVFGDFNHGKSTLLNAILGSKTLPIDLIPTTGGAIKVVYGEKIITKITLKSGEVISKAGSEILTEFAILDDDRRMRDDVLKIEVSYPHPFLKMGVELIDLPGTNDRDEQDSFVRTQLLAADLIIYVLDTRKLMTLGEREHLRDWLEHRGINTVIFVANFTNMLEPEERQEVQHRLRFVAESFRSQLPTGVSNLYRVDALPALRARLKGDDNLLHTSGLPTLISALQTIFDRQQTEIHNLRHQILKPITLSLKNLLQREIAPLEGEIAILSAKQTRENQLKQQAKTLIESGWNQSLIELERWLYLPTLTDTYQSPIITALHQQTFPAWERDNITPKLQHFQIEINNWLIKLAQFFEIPPTTPLLLSPPEAPTVELPTPTPPHTTSSLKVAPTAIATGLGWMFGGPIGAAVIGGASILAGKAGTSEQSNPQSNTTAIYLEAAEDYLCCLNLETLAQIQQYRAKATISLNTAIPTAKSSDLQQHQQLSALKNCLQNIA